MAREVGEAAWQKKGACLKDDDLRKMQFRIAIGPERGRRFLAALENDSLFLSKKVRGAATATNRAPPPMPSPPPPPTATKWAPPPMPLPPPPRP